MEAAARRMRRVRPVAIKSVVSLVEEFLLKLMVVRGEPMGSARMVETMPAQARTGQRRGSEVRYIVIVWFLTSVF